MAKKTGKAEARTTYDVDSDFVPTVSGVALTLKEFPSGTAHEATIRLSVEQARDLIDVLSNYVADNEEDEDDQDDDE